MMQNPEKAPDLSKLSNQEILFRLERLSRSKRKITHLVLCHIVIVDDRKLYLALGYESLYKYLTQHLHYSESAAYHRLQAARVLKKNPEIAEKIEAGTLNLSQLVQVEQSLKQEQKTGQKLSPESRQELLTKLENKSVFETEKILASELNLTPKALQKIKPQKDDSVRLELTLSQEQYGILKKAQSLISHSVPENNLAEEITYLAQAHIKRIEGANKAKASKTSSSQKNETENSTKETRSPQKNSTSISAEETLSPNNGTPISSEEPFSPHDSTAPISEENLNPEENKTQNSSEETSDLQKNNIQSCSEERPSPEENRTHISPEAKPSLTPSFSNSPFKHKTVRQKRKALSLKVRRVIFQRAGHCCEYSHSLTGKRCASQFQLQIDHVIPLACGDTDELTNLRLLCGICNRREAQRWGLKRPS